MYDLHVRPGSSPDVGLKCQQNILLSRTHTTYHPTTPGPSRPTPWTDTTFPPLICREKILGAFWASSPAVRPWTRREAVLPPPTRRERDSCRLLRAVESATRPGMWLVPRVVASLGTIAPFNTTPAPPLPPCWRRSLGRALTGTRSTGHEVEVVYRCFGAFQSLYPVRRPIS